MRLSKASTSFLFVTAAFAPREAVASDHILDVAVIGAGPGGLATALALSKNDSHSIAIFERASAFRPIGAALGLNDPGYAALSSLAPSLAELVRSKAANPQWQVLQRPDGEILFDDECFFHDTGFTWLGWYTLQVALKDALPNSIPIHLMHRLVSIEQETGFVSLRFSVQDAEGKVLQEKTVRTRVLVGADGYQSVVRRNAVSDGEPLYTGTMTWRGIIDKSDFDAQAFGAPFQSKNENGVLSIIGDRKNFWIMDCGDGQIAWTGTALQDSSEKSSSARDSAMVAFEGWPAMVIAMMKATDPEAIIESGVFDRDPVESWGVANGGKYQRVTLLGDAAHPMRPSLGLGSTNAFQDALSLSSKLQGVDLRNTSDVARALDLYEQERIAVTSPLIIKARKGGEASHDEDQADRFKKVMDTMLASKKLQASEL
jgi:salicylate hydroxylase